MKVVWTDRARQRLRQLHDYIAADAPWSRRRSSSASSCARVNYRPRRGRAEKSRSINATTCANYWTRLTESFTGCIPIVSTCSRCDTTGNSCRAT